MSKLLDNPAESVIQIFPNQVATITPSHAQWRSRVALEIKNVVAYIDYLKQAENALWFFLRPAQDKRFNFQRWDGFLKIPTRPDIQFELRIVLTSKYPQVFPRAFAEQKIQDYCAGNIYPRNIWQDNPHDQNGKKFIMICHDHMKEQAGAWTPNLSIAHFFIREVWYWWMSKINRVIHEWDKSKGYI